LNKALKDEWILQKEQDKFYCFSHDKLQQTIYQNIKKSELQNIHFRIGNYLYNNDDLNKKTILYTNHLNIGYELFNNLELLVKLNIKSSLQAKKNGDFLNALEYIKQAMSFLDKQEYATCDIQILKERAECEHLCNNSDEAIIYYEMALGLCVDVKQKSLIYELLIKLYSDISDFQKAYSIGRDATALFEFTMPKSFIAPLFAVDFLRVRYKLKNTKIQELIFLEESLDEEFILLVKLISNTLQSAFQIQPELCVANALKVVELCLDRGLTKESVIAFTVFGVIFEGGILGNHKIGLEYYKLSLNMLEKFQNTVQHSEVKFVCGYFGVSWNSPAKYTESIWEQSYFDGLSIGDWFHTSCAAAGIIQSMFIRGEKFDLIESKIDEFSIVLQNIGSNEKILVVGGGNSAAEYAYELAEQNNTVTLVYRKAKFGRLNPENEKIIYQYNGQELLRLRMDTDIESLENHHGKVKVQFNDGYHTIYDRVIYAIGGTSPVDFLKNCNINVDDKGMPIYDDHYETNVPCLYVAGDIAFNSGGSIAMALNHGYHIVNNILRKRGKLHSFTHKVEKIQ
jgi:predicted ATPase